MSTGLQELADRAELADLLARQNLWLDEQRFDEAGRIFTTDATVRTQSGHSVGLEALTAQAHRVHAGFTATQHLTSGVLIEVDGDQAEVRANLIAVLVDETTAPRPSLAVGERYLFEAIRTADGWRFSSLQVDPIWTSAVLR